MYFQKSTIWSNTSNQTFACYSAAGRSAKYKQKHLIKIIILPPNVQF